MTTAMKLPIEIDELKSILRQYGVTSASVFGSYARGDARPDSDIDLLVEYAPGTSLFKIIGLQDELESLTGNHVDLVSAKFIKPRLARRIKADLVSIF